MRAASENPWQHCGHWGQGWLPSSDGCAGGADLRGLRGGCGLPAVGEAPSLTRESRVKSALEMSRPAALLPLWPLPHGQHLSAVKRVAPPW